LRGVSPIELAFIVLLEPSSSVDAAAAGLGETPTRTPMTRVPP
jgi:hypothetical protein